jgi:hypothetical protein
MDRKATKTLQRKPIKRPRPSASMNTYVPRTEFGRRLWKIRRRILISGQPLLDWEGLETELRARRGEPADNL